MQHRSEISDALLVYNPLSKIKNFAFENHQSTQCTSDCDRTTTSIDIRLIVDTKFKWKCQNLWGRWEQLTQPLMAKEIWKFSNTLSDGWEVHVNLIAVISTKLFQSMFLQNIFQIKISRQLCSNIGRQFHFNYLKRWKIKSSSKSKQWKHSLQSRQTIDLLKSNLKEACFVQTLSESLPSM